MTLQRVRDPYSLSQCKKCGVCGYRLESDNGLIWHQSRCHANVFHENVGPKRGYLSYMQQRKVVRTTANTAKKCGVGGCGNAWSIGETVDVINDPMWIVCTDCGDEFVQQGQGYRMEPKNKTKKTAPSGKNGAAENVARGNKESIPADFAQWQNCVNSLLDHLMTGDEEHGHAIIMLRRRVEELEARVEKQKTLINNQSDALEALLAEHPEINQWTTSLNPQPIPGAIILSAPPGDATTCAPQQKPSGK